MVARGGLRGGEGCSDTNKTDRIGCVVYCVDHQRVQVYKGERGRWRLNPKPSRIQIQLSTDKTNSIHF